MELIEKQIYQPAGIKFDSKIHFLCDIDLEGVIFPGYFFKITRDNLDLLRADFFVARSNKNTEMLPRPKLSYKNTYDNLNPDKLKNISVFLYFDLFTTPTVQLMLVIDSGEYGIFFKLLLTDKYLSIFQQKQHTNYLTLVPCQQGKAVPMLINTPDYNNGDLFNIKEVEETYFYYPKEYKRIDENKKEINFTEICCKNRGVFTLNHKISKQYESIFRKYLLLNKDDVDYNNRIENHKDFYRVYERIYSVNDALAFL